MVTDRLVLAMGMLILAGCGGGGTTDAPPPPPPPGVEEDASQAPAASTTPAAPKPVALDSSLIPEPGAELTREVFNYRGGSRDPFVSLLEGKNVGPELGDLDVVGIAFVSDDAKSSAAVLWDRVHAKQYTAREGERVGRARVVAITRLAVRFTIDDFGTQREVTLALRKREDVP